MQSELMIWKQVVSHGLKIYVSKQYGACLQEGNWVECLVDHLYAQFNSKNLNMPACILHQRILVIFV